MGPWELYEQSPYWTQLGLAFDKADARAIEIARKIDNAREGDEGEDEDED